MDLPTERDRSRMLLTLAAIGVLIAASALYWYFFGSRPSSSAVILPEVSEVAIPVDSETIDEAQGAELGVDIVGAVQQPGLYYFEPGARVADAVRAAGGYAPNANREAINEAVRLKDEQQIRVPKVEDDVAPADAPALADVSPTAPAILDLNTVDAQALEALPGIGPDMAGRIVAYREANGPFGAVEHLLDVPGIGPATLTTLSQYLTVAP